MKELITITEAASDGEYLVAVLPLRTAVVVAKSNGEWLPLYGYRRDPCTGTYDRVDLPACYELNDTIMDALDAFVASRADAPPHWSAQVMLRRVER